MTNKKEETKFLTRSEILKAPDLPLIEIDVPEWGGSVYVRALDGTERDDYEVKVLGAVGPNRLENARAKLVSVGCVNAKGKRVFTKSDVVALGKKSGAALDRLFTVIMKESGLNNQDIEALVKNYVSGLSNDSTSSSDEN